MEHEAYRPGAQVLGDWNIVSCLGAGSYGKVFEIERSEFGQTYRAALKVITVPQSSAEVRSVISEGMSVSQAEAYFHGIVEELMHEFSIMFKLKGTANIVSCEDLRVLEHPDGIGWDILIRMELLHPLLPYVYQHPMARRDIIRLGIDICKALELCQRYNIIHRDIKPENIFISDNGDYKLGDFGIARTIERTTSGLSKKGTYSYMAPEVYAGREYGFSVDTYSLGLVLYRMLNKNRGPFLPQPPEAITFSSREQALARRMSGEPLPRPFYGEGRLGEIVLKACAFDPKDRYSSPQQLRQELEAILYTQTDAAVIYPDGDELTMDRESYASARYAAAFGTSTSKSASATQGVFTGDYHTKAEATSEERTQSAFGSEEPKGAGTKKKRKKIGRLIIGIVAAALLVPVVLCVIGAIPIPAAIHNIFVPQTIPEALREYEEAGTLEKLYENGNLSGYQVVAYREDGELDSVQIFDTAGNCVRNELYNSDGTLSHYNLNEYDSSGNCIKSEAYSSDGSLFGCNKFEYDSNGNQIRAESYSSDGTLLGYVLYEYGLAGNKAQEKYYGADGKLDYVYEYDLNGNLKETESYGLDGKRNNLYEYNANGNAVKKEWYTQWGNIAFYAVYEYDSDEKLIKEKRYDGNGNLWAHFLYEYDSGKNLIKETCYDSDDLRYCVYEYRTEGALVDNSKYELYQYTSRGDLTAEKRYSKDGSLEECILYEYDANGDLTKKEWYEADNYLDFYVVFEYDSNRNCVRIDVCNSDGELNSYYLFEYDLDGNVIKRECYSTGELEAWFLYKYDSNGNRTEMEQYGVGVGLNGYAIFEYDSNGNRIKAYGNEYDSHGYMIRDESGAPKLDAVSLYEYDLDGNRLSDADSDAVDLLEYDSKGNLIKRERYSTDGRLQAYAITKGCGEKVWYNPDGTHRS